MEKWENPAASAKTWILQTRKIRKIGFRQLESDANRRNVLEPGSKLRAAALQPACQADCLAEPLTAAYIAVQPPSMVNSDPWMNADSFEAR